MQVTSVEKKSNEWMVTAVSILLIGIAIVAFGAVISRMGLLNSFVGGESAPSMSLNTAVSGNIILFTQKMSFGQEEIRLKVGQTITISLDNKDFYAHSFDVDELNLHIPMPANNQVITGFTVAQLGRYPFYCAVLGHKEAGMIGTLVVEP